jgi:toxin-antitoxin system PIN domain toxin
VILVDANILIYAYQSSAKEHASSLAWLDEQFAGREQVALPWESLNAFLRLVSNPRVFSEPATMADAWRQVDAWLRMPNVWIPVPTPQHAAIMTELCGASQLAADDVPDAHLASLTISHGLKLATHDRGFGRFDGLRWFDPIGK